MIRTAARLLAATVLLGPEETERYVQWTIHECKDVQKRRATLERRTDPNAKRGSSA